MRIVATSLNYDMPKHVVSVIVFPLLLLYTTVFCSTVSSHVETSFHPQLKPRVLHTERLWKSKGSLEGIVTAAFFASAGIAAFLGLSRIVGAFAIGMAVASTRIIKQVHEYVD